MGKILNKKKFISHTKCYFILLFFKEIFIELGENSYLLAFLFGSGKKIKRNFFLILLPKLQANKQRKIFKI